MTTYTIRLEFLDRPLMTSNEQRRAHWTKVRSAKRDTELAAFYSLRRAKITVTTPVEVHLTWFAPDNRRRDSDSLAPCLKAVLDAMVTAHVIPDDSSEYVRRSGCSVVVDRADPRIELSIRECEQPKDAA